jgi:hypothetical protein
MKVRWAVPRSGLLGCSALALGALLAISQSGPPNHGVSTTPNNPIVTHGGNNADYSTFGLPADSVGMSSVEMARRAQLARVFAAERNKQNAADVTKLLALAKSLNDDFAGAGLGASPGASSASSAEDQIRKLKEIEKLAGRVKHRTAAPTTLQVSLPQ